LRPQGGDLRLEAADLVLELREALGELRLLPIDRRASGVEQAALAGHGCGHARNLDAGGEEIGELDGLQVVPLGGEPRLTGLQLVELRDQHGEVGAGHRLVELHQEVARFDGGAVLDEDLADDAARRVLDLLDVRVDGDLPRGDHRAGERGGRSPDAEPAAEQGDHGDAAENLVPNRTSESRQGRSLLLGCHEN
jgi:hypothetical protein